ncbi:MAG: rRNA maturation RNase YbeY [Gammaproteobacteria bacterium]|jgi:probable rRNA maturation factor|nr:rRNA maturation RNase YbeY [Gammaproteobacteria bacterium]
MVAAVAPRCGATRAVDLALTVQIACPTRGLPARADFEAAACAALRGRRGCAELTLRLVDADEGRALNQRWRGKDYATNVLSFPATGLAAVAPELLGDIALCAPVIAAEARAQGKRALDHWRHLTVHGVLHLLGYDHTRDAQALVMEAAERAALASLGVADPYQA